MLTDEEIDARVRSAAVGPSVAPFAPPVGDIAARARQRTRRRRLGVGGVLASVVVAVGAAVFLQSEPQRQRVDIISPPTSAPPATSPTTSAALPTAQLVDAWRAETGGEMSSGSLAVDGAVLLAAPTHLFDAVDDDTTVFGLDLETGSERWTAGQPPGVALSRATAPGLVLASAQYDRLTAFSSETGAERWLATFQPGATCYGFGPALASGSVVYALASERCEGASAPAVAFAFDADSGAELWRTELPGTVEGLWSAPVEVDGTVAFLAFAGSPGASWSDGFFGLDAATGDIRWSKLFSIGGQAYSDRGPVDADGSILLTPLTGELVAVDPVTGAVRWSTPADTSRTSGPPLVADGVVYASGPDGLVALDAGSGASRWRDAGGAGGLEVVRAGSFLLVTHAPDRTVTAHDPATGTVLWTVPAVAGHGKQPLGPFLATGDEFAVILDGGYAAPAGPLPTGTGSLRVVDIATGTVVAEESFDELLVQAVISNDMVVVAALDGTVIALRIT
jgi:outer membrane protein assembly factor BamB